LLPILTAAVLIPGTATLAAPQRPAIPEGNANTSRAAGATSPKIRVNHPPMESSLFQAFQRAVYAPEHSGSGTVGFDNPAQHLNADLTRDGLSVRTGSGNRTSARLRLSGIGYLSVISHEGRFRSLPATSPRIEGQRVTYHRGEVTEWYQNSSRGIEQGFTVASRPAGKTATSRLALRLDVSGALCPEASKDGRSVHLKGVGRDLNYTGLAAWDANHRPLPARMTISGRRIEIAVDDRKAVYPVTIDPLLEQGIFFVQNGQFGDNVGWSVAIQGDTAVIGAPGTNNGVGAAYVFTRSAGSWTQAAELVPSQSWNSSFGYSVAISSGRIAVGAPTFNDSYAGAVYLFDRNGATLTPEAPLNGFQAGDGLGFAVAIDDNALVVKELRSPVDQNNAFYVYVNTGGVWTPSSGYGSIGQVGSLALSNGLLVVCSPPYHAWTFQWTGNGAFNGFTNVGNLYVSGLPTTDNFAASVAIGRGGNTVLLGAPGQNNGTGTVYAFDIYGNLASQITPADGQPNDGFGTAIASSSNLLAIGSPQHTDGAQNPGGAVYLYTPIPTGYVFDFEQPATADASGIQYGAALAMDGNTLIIGAPQFLNAEGIAYAFVDAPPTAVDDTYAAASNVTLSVNAANGVLTNDTNNGTGTLTAVLQSGPSNGSLTLNPDGSFTYTSNPGFIGADTFQYTANNDLGASNTAVVTIQVGNPTFVNVPYQTGDEGSPVTLKATLTLGASFNPQKGIAGQSLSFLINGSGVGSATTDAKGNASLSYTPSAPGILVLTVQFAGNAKDAPSSGDADIVIRNKTSLVFNPDTASVGQGAILGGYLALTDSGQPLVGSTVTLSLNGKKVGSSVSDSNGYVAFNVGNQYHAGTFNYQASFKGDYYNAPITVTAPLIVYAAGTSTTAGNATGTIGAAVVLKAKVTSQITLAGVSGIPVTFLINGTAVGTATSGAGGVTTLSYVLPAGTPLGASQLVAQFAGSNDYTGSTSSAATLTVSAGTSITATNVSGKAGTSVTLSALLQTSPGGSAVSGEKLTFLVDGKAVGAATTNGNGQAAHAYKIPSGTAAGAHTITVTHKAANDYGASTGTATLTVN
jgi:hypothetical protein